MRRPIEDEATDDERTTRGTLPGRPARTGRRATGLVAGGTLLLALGATAVAADTNDPPDGFVTEDPAFDESAPFRDGHWIGSLSAAGPVSADFGNAAISMHTAMSGVFDVVVSGDVVAGGTWNLSGTSQGAVSTPMGPGSIGNVYHGSGEVGGDQDALVLGGGVDTTWMMTIGGSTDVSQDPLRLGPFEVAVTDADCQRLLGDWEAAFAAEIAAAGGWESGLTGSFEATHTQEPPDDALLQDLYEVVDRYNDWVDGVRDGVYRDLEDGETGLFDDALGPMLDLLDELYQLERRLGDLGDDEACLFGQDLGTYSFLLTAGIQDLAWWLLGVVDDFTADELELLGRGLLGVGGIGDGAIRPQRAAQLEQRWVERANEVFERSLFDDDPPYCTPASPCIDADDDIVALAVFGAQMGFTFEVAGITIEPDDMASMLADLEDE